MLSWNTSESEQCPEWKALLTELLAAIAKRLTSIADYSSFRGVCSSWRSAATFHNFDRGFPRAPRLLYFVEEREEASVLGDALAGKREEIPVLGDAALSEESEETSVLGDGDALSEGSEETPIQGKIVANFLDLESSTCKITNFPPATYCPYKYLSCAGWILVSNDTQVSLKHFMLGINIELPRLNTFGCSCNSFITKMVLSGSPIEADLLVMVIWGFDDQLAFCRPGDECWTIIDWWEGFFYDIIYHNSKLYALDYSLTVVECDIRGSNPTKIVQVFDFPPDDMIKSIFVVQQFLVESFGKFLIVLQCMSRNASHHFRIFEIELKDGSYVEIDNLGNRCLFLGHNSSICVEFPASSRVKLKPNCIYLSKSKVATWEPDVGVYTLADGCFQDLSAMFDFCFPPPIWVVPSI